MRFLESVVSILGLGLGILSLAPLPQVLCDPLLVKTTLGPVEGKYNTVKTSSGNTQVRVWGSIPYAADTGGENRFRPPQPRTPWNETRQATSYGLPATACIQPAGLLYSQTEDCLIVNVASPSNATENSNLPVMVWIHGGSLRNGAAGLYDGSQFVVEQNVVFVAVNYRLGYFGYLALEELEAEGGSLGNMGFLDQHMALEWVHNNIAAFGGNPNLVTIFGESAGGTSVGSHLTSPVTFNSEFYPFFHRAIIESGQSSFAWTKDQALLLANHQITQMNQCTNLSGPSLLSCLRGLSTDVIINTKLSNKLNFAHTIDNKIILDVASKQIQSGQWAKVPLFQGTNHDENSAFLCEVFPTNYTSVTRDDVVFNLLKNNNNLTLANNLVDQYPLADYNNSYWVAAVQLETDATFRCPAKSNVEAASESVDNVYMYQLNIVPGFTSACQRTEHASELPFLFSSTLGGFDVFYQYTQDDLKVSEAMRKAWADFAKTGVPTINDQPWPRYCSSNNNDNKVSGCSEEYVAIVTVEEGLFVNQFKFRDQQCQFFIDNAQAIADSFVIDPTE